MSMDLTGENIAQLKALFPEAVTEGKIDFEVLKALLGGEVEKRQEYYKFTWNGKEEARAYARTRSMGTLRPCEAESSGKDGTPGKFDSDNLYIEGDNLEVLKLLQGPYHKKVKMIYIDPPYNTGKDFVYPDNFRDSIGNYKALTGQSDDEGKATRANPETSGRYHTDWLNMMYPRLILARNLLTDDGVIFISIDDTEVANLRKLCDDVFGEENFVSTFIWKKKQGGGNDSNHVVVEHEHIICFTRSDCSLILGLDKNYVLDDALYPFKDNKGEYGLITLDKASIQFSQSLLFEIQGPDGHKYMPRIVKGKQSCWRWSKEKVEKEYSDLVFRNDKVYTKYYRPDGITPRSLLIDSVYGRTESGNDDIKSIFEQNPFSYPKPVLLIKHLISIGLINRNDIILDFFSGSGTTAHAVMQLNAEDGGNRKYIMVQLPEVCEEGTEAAKAGYKNICEIGKERIRRAARKVVSDKWAAISKDVKAEYGCTVISDKEKVVSDKEKVRYGCKELSGTDCLAKVNGCGEDDLFAGEKTAEGGTLCPIRSDAESGGIHSIQHCGGTGKELNQGISAISGNSTGEQSRTGNAAASMCSSELSCSFGHFGSHGTTSGSGQDASCPYKNTPHCPLITKYCSDIGFKVFKLDTSNLVPWNPNAETLEKDLFAAVDNVLADRTTEDLLYEILLKCNLQPTLPIEKKQVGANTVYIVGMGALAICLDKKIPASIAEEIVKLRDEYAPIVPMQVVFRDNGFDDVSKTNALQILKQAGFEEKSIQTI